MTNAYSELHLLSRKKNAIKKRIKTILNKTCFDLVFHFLESLLCQQWRLWVAAIDGGLGASANSVSHSKNKHLI